MAKRPKFDRRSDQLALEVDSPFAHNLHTNPPRELLEQARQSQGQATMAPGPLLPDSSVVVATRWTTGGEVAMVDDAGESAAKVANQSLNPVGMQIYWNLSSLKMAVREAAAVALVGELRANQEDFVSSGSEEGIGEV